MNKGREKEADRMWSKGGTFHLWNHPKFAYRKEIHYSVSLHQVIHSFIHSFRSSLGVASVLAPVMVLDVCVWLRVCVRARVCVYWLCTPFVRLQFVYWFWAITCFSRRGPWVVEQDLFLLCYFLNDNLKDWNMWIGEEAGMLSTKYYAKQKRQMQNWTWR